MARGSGQPTLRRHILTGAAAFNPVFPSIQRSYSEQQLSSMPAGARIRIASHSDVPVLVSLINHAFAVERFFKPGDRTSPDQVHALLEKGTFHLMSKPLP